MNGRFLLRKNEVSEVGREINIEELRALLQEIQETTQWQIFEMIRNIQMEIAKSYSVSKDNPDTFLHLYGSKKDIRIKIETKQKQADILIPKNSTFL